VGRRSPTPDPRLFGALANALEPVPQRQLRIVPLDLVKEIGAAASGLRRKSPLVKDAISINVEISRLAALVAIYSSEKGSIDSNNSTSRCRPNRHRASVPAESV
jgi:hypothetical protein